MSDLYATGFEQGERAAMDDRRAGRAMRDRPAHITNGTTFHHGWWDGYTPRSLAWWRPATGMRHEVAMPVAAVLDAPHSAQVVAAPSRPAPRPAIGVAVDESHLRAIRARDLRTTPFHARTA